MTSPGRKTGAGDSDRHDASAGTGEDQCGDRDTTDTPQSAVDLELSAKVLSQLLPLLRRLAEKRGGQGVTVTT